MYVLQLFNQYRSQFNGEECVVFQTEEIIRNAGHRTKLLLRSSRGLERSLRGKMTAFFQGIYSRTAFREITTELQADRSDVVHAHNLYPLFSPSVLAACRQQKVPVVLSIHNQGLTCPRSDHLYRGRVCDRCLGGNEHRCVIQNCRQSLFESTAYALRSIVARRFRLFHDNGTSYIALSNFARDWLVKAGYERGRIQVLPNMAPLDGEPADPSLGTYVAFAGRISAEKGVSTLLKTARKLPDIPIAIAGDGPQMDDVIRESAGSNVRLLGQLSPNEVPRFLRAARFAVAPSTCFEMCPLVILETMALGIPVIASRIGGPPELVMDKQSGLLFEPGNAADLAQNIWRLWHDPQLCRKLGERGRQRMEQEHSPATYTRRLFELYDLAIDRARSQ